MANDDEGTPTTPEEHFARRIRAERQARGWTQAELAERLKEHGVDLHFTAIAKIEQPDPARQRAIRLNEAAALAQTFGVPLQHLLYSADGLVEAAQHHARATANMMLTDTDHLIDSLDALRLAKNEAGHSSSDNRALALMIANTVGVLRIVSAIEFTLRGNGAYDEYEKAAAGIVQWLDDPDDEDDEEP